MKHPAARSYLGNIFFLNMPLAINPQATIDDSDLDESRGTCSQIPERHSHTHGLHFIETEPYPKDPLSPALMDKGTQPGTQSADNEKWYQEQRQSFERYRSAFDLYSSAIRRNPVVESYRNSWQMEPAWLPHICAQTVQKTLEQMSQTGCSSDTTRCDFGPELGTRKSALSNLSLISDFLVPAKMPYMTYMSPVYGLVLCTPFYSTIPGVICSIPEVLFSMRFLTIDRVIKNPIFRHELIFNTKLKVELPIQLSDAKANHSFWSQLEFETKEVLSHTIARAPTPILPIFLNETRKLMLSVVPCSLSPHVAFYYNSERLLEGGMTADSPMLSDFLKFTLSVIDACVLPIRKSWVHKMASYFSKAQDDAKLLVSGLRVAIWLLNQTKVDYINAQIKQRAEMLNENVTHIERGYYQAMVASETLSESGATYWLSRQPSVLELRDAGPVDKRLVELSSCPVVNKMSRLVAGFIWTQLRRNSSDNELLPMFGLDRCRIRSIRRKVDAYIHDRVHIDASNFCPDKYRVVLPKLIWGKELVHSPLFLLIERRVLSNLAVRCLQNLIDVTRVDTRIRCETKPNLSFTGWEHSHSSNQSEVYNKLRCSPSEMTVSLDAVESEISILLTLHWRAASFLYCKN